MMHFEPPIRIARASDAPELAAFVNYAGEGLPLHLWTGMAGPGGDPWEIGRARQAKKAGEGQIFVVDMGQGAVAGLTGYAIGPSPDPVPDDMPPIFRPLQELENLAAPSWYVNVLATDPAWRGRGLGGLLLETAEQVARELGETRMSIIVADTNDGARRLYERHGYREAARRPCVREGWQTDIAEWVLLLKDLG